MQLEQLGMACAAADTYTQAALVHAARHDRRGELTVVPNAAWLNATAHAACSAPD
jgi:hypothetical protein